MLLETAPQSPVSPAPQIECGSCERKLPLRMSTGNETAALWFCATCNVPYVACCVEEALKAQALSVRLDGRYFDVSQLPTITPARRQEIARLVNRAPTSAQAEKRRSKRIAKSLVVPAVSLGPGMVPVGDAFQVMVTNISKEGIGLVHDGQIPCQYIAIELRATPDNPVQMIVRLVRHRQLDAIYYEIGGEFFVRLGGAQRLE